MKRFLILLAAFVFVAGAGTWFGYRLGRPSPPSPAPNRVSALDPETRYYCEVVKRASVPRFEANDIPMNDALAQIERQINETPFLLHERIKFRIVSRNLCEDNVTIVLRDASLVSLLNLISEQTRFEYKIDGPNSQIMFFRNTDTIGGEDHVDDGTQEDPNVLPPLR